MMPMPGTHWCTVVTANPTGQQQHPLLRSHQLLQPSRPLCSWVVRSAKVGRGQQRASSAHHTHRPIAVATVQICHRTQGGELLKQAKTKYTAKDLMGALKLYEDVLAQVSMCVCKDSKDRRQ